MSAVDAVLTAVVESVAYVSSRVLGKTLNIKKEKARRVTEAILLVAFAAFFLSLAVMGVGT